jgi:hypothetical protein
MFEIHDFNPILQRNFNYNLVIFLKIIVYMFIYGLFKEAVSSSDCLVANCGLVNE